MVRIEQRSVTHDFLNVVHHAIEIPLRIHLVLAAQGKPIQSLHRADVGKNRFDDGDALLIKNCAP